jgi:hypothetical protein
MRLWISSRFLRALTVMGLLALGAGLARATIIPNLDNVVNNGDGTFTYNYHADLAADQRVDNTDFLTMYDFFGLVPGSVVVNAPGWTVSYQNVGVTPPSTLPTDDPTIPNFTITRTGATIGGPQTPLFTFSAASISGLTTTHSFAAEATRSTGDLTGTKIQNVGLVLGPTSSTPEPASLALLGIGVPVALAVLRRRAKSDAV